MQTKILLPYTAMALVTLAACGVGRPAAPLSLTYVTDPNAVTGDANSPAGGAYVNSPLTGFTAEDGGQHCLTAAAAPVGSPLVLAACDPNAANQKWLMIQGRFQLAGDANTCAEHRAPNEAIVTAACAPQSQAQLFDVTPRGLLRAVDSIGGKDPNDLCWATTAVGTQAVDCTASNTTSFALVGVRLRHADAPDVCLEATHTTPTLNGPAYPAACSATRGQLWTLQRGKLFLSLQSNNLCLGLTGGNSMGGTLALLGCDAPDAYEGFWFDAAAAAVHYSQAANACVVSNSAAVQASTDTPSAVNDCAQAQPWVLSGP